MTEPTLATPKRHFATMVTTPEATSFRHVGETEIRTMTSALIARFEPVIANHGFKVANHDFHDAGRGLAFTLTYSHFDTISRRPSETGNETTYTPSFEAEKP